MDDKDHFRVVKGDIFGVEADALAFSANPSPHPAVGCMELEVFQRAGFGKLSAEREKYGMRDYGEVTVTEGCGLPFKWLLHAAAPMYLGNSYSEEELLIKCYKNCLTEASKRGASSVAFALLGSGSLGFGSLLAFDIAREAINDTAPSLRKMDIMLVIRDSRDFEDIDRFRNFTEEYVRRTVEEMRSEELSEEYIADVLEEGEEIRLHQDYVRAQIAGLREGHLIYRQIVREKERFLAAEPGKTEKNFAHKKIAETVNRWIDQPKEEFTGKPYDHTRRFSSHLAEKAVLSKPTLVKIAAPTGTYVPKRDTLILLAVAMELSKEERIRFILYGDEDKKYPRTEKERLIEEILSEHGSRLPSCTTLDSELYTRSEGRFMLYTDREKSGKSGKSGTKTKDK